MDQTLICIDYTNHWANFKHFHKIDKKFIHCCGIGEGTFQLLREKSSQIN